MADQFPFGHFTSNKEITVIRTTTDFAKAFRAARRVSTPLIAVRTPDPASSVQLVLSTLTGACGETAALQWDAIPARHGSGATLYWRGKRQIVRLISRWIRRSLRWCCERMYMEARSMYRDQGPVEMRPVGESCV